MECVCDLGLERVKNVLYDILCTLMFTCLKFFISFRCILEAHLAVSQILLNVVSNLRSPIVQ